MWRCKEHILEMERVILMVLIEKIFSDVGSAKREEKICEG